MANIRDVVTDLCASCTQPISVFRQSFERAERGLTQSSPALALSLNAQPGMSNEF